MGKNIVNLFWTGGWDSTFRILELLIIKERKVQPYYIIDSDRLSTGTELITMKNIKKLLFKRYPKTKKLLMPTKFREKDDIFSNQLISENYKKLNLGSQYDWLARFASEEKIQNAELCIVKDGRVHTYLKQYISKINDKGESNYIMIAKRNDAPECMIFRYFRFPLLNKNKLDMEAIAKNNGFIDIMEVTWFCHRPRRNNTPCGICKPCSITLKAGLKRRIPFTSRIRYKLSVNIKIRNYFEKNPRVHICLRNIKRSIIEFIKKLL